MTGTKFSTLPTLKLYLSDNPFIKYDIFEFSVKFPPRGTPIGIVTQYCENKNMSYISHSENNSPYNRAFPEIIRIIVWILSIGRKEPKTVQHFMEAISIQKLTGKFNRINAIT